MFAGPKKFALEFVKVLRDRKGQPVMSTTGKVIRRTLRTDSPAKVAAFEVTNCFTKGKSP